MRPEKHAAYIFFSRRFFTAISWNAICQFAHTSQKQMEETIYGTIGMGPEAAGISGAARGVKNRCFNYRRRDLRRFMRVFPATGRCRLYLSRGRQDRRRKYKKHDRENYRPARLDL